MAQQDNPHLTITLSGRPPVKIKKDDWPVVASAEDKQYDNRYEVQANRKATWKLTVRQAADGRTIVYAVYRYDTNWENSQSYDIRGGEMIRVDGASAEDIGDNAAIIQAIQRVGADIEGRMPDGPQWGPGVFPRLVHECIADLPAEEL